MKPTVPSLAEADGVRAWLATQTMDRLLAAYPSAADVLAEHGVDATFDDLIAHVHSA